MEQFRLAKLHKPVFELFHRPHQGMFQAWLLISSSVLWSIWKERNAKTFGDDDKPANVIAHLAISSALFFGQGAALWSCGPPVHPGPSPNPHFLGRSPSRYAQNHTLYNPTFLLLCNSKVVFHKSRTMYKIFILHMSF